VTDINLPFERIKNRVSYQTTLKRESGTGFQGPQTVTCFQQTQFYRITSKIKIMILRFIF